ncbi:hypothetical protein EKO27_g11376 [Xylaria grammica]|uniref:Uncharacterized protein n=1 Tax=Xylaria grammica TaxID=363999 RepID=A0A439CNJ3_9PEZI|nr:hypothetical protein EKO27_g11376 [Xylaria grammica]
MKRFYLLHHLDYIQVPTGQDEQVFTNSILGRVVKDYREPSRNYVNITRTTENAAVLDSKSNKLDNLWQSVSHAKSSKLKLMLQKVVGIEHESAEAAHRQVDAGTVTYHYFVHDDAIEHARRDPNIKEKLTTWLARGGSRVWLIVGFIIARTTDAGDGDDTTRGTKAAVDPAAALLQDASINIEASRESNRAQDGGANVSELSVIAVRYMCLQRPYLSRGAEPTTKLKNGPADFYADGSEQKSEDWVADVVDGSITDILQDSDELDHEDFGDISFAFDVDDEDYDEPSEDEDDAHDGGEDEAYD